MIVERTAAFRRDVRELTNLAEGDLARAWLDFTDGVAAREWLLDVLPGLQAVYGAAAASLAADYYDDLRESAAARHAFYAIVPEPAPLAKAEVLARVAAGSLFSAEPNLMGALTLARGGIQRLITNEARSTVVVSSLEDPSAQGWRRVGGGACDWCRQYLDGEVHYVEGYDFKAHDHCGCTAEPVFG